MTSTGPWRRVSRSLSVLFWLTLGKIGVLMASGLIAASLLDSMTSMEEVERAMSLLTMVMVGVFAVEVAVIAALVGYTAVPENSGARGGAITAVVLAVACLGMDLLTTLPMFARDYEAMAEGSAWETLSTLGKLAFFFVQMNSFRSLATHLGEAALAKTASTCMLLVGILVGIAIVGGLLVGASRSEALGILIAVAVVGLAIGALVLHLIVIYKLARRAGSEEDVASAFA